MTSCGRILKVWRIYQLPSVAVFSSSRLGAGFVTTAAKSLGLLFQLALRARVAAGGGLPEVGAAETRTPAQRWRAEPLGRAWFTLVTLGLRTDCLDF